MKGNTELRLELTATATFGLEAVVRREIEALGYKILKREDGRITFLGNETAIARSNLWLRCADRVLLKMGEFEVPDFEALFQQTKGIPWEELIPADGRFVITGNSVKSALHSVPACQSIIKKAVAERLGEFYGVEHLEETGAEYDVRFTILKDHATLSVDTSGQGLHKRGYRKRTVEAPIKETLAAAMVQLSFWHSDRILADPCCGSGTIAIEAAMIGMNIAPGLNREFVSEGWHIIDGDIWKKERRAAFEEIKHDSRLMISASDKDRHAVEAARQNALEAGVADRICFGIADIGSLRSRIPASWTESGEGQEKNEKGGIIITNPPYGERIGDRDDIKHIYQTLRRFLDENEKWSLFMITSDKTAEKKAAGRPADRRRKLYNGRLEVCYYQFHGKK